MRARLLIAERDQVTQAFLADNLQADGYDVYVASSPEQAAKLMDAHVFDLCLISLNGMTLSFLDAHHREQPVVVLSPPVDHLAVVRYLDRGADDVIFKPFTYTELAARLRSALRRAHRAPALLHPHPSMTVDAAARAVTVDGTPVVLSKKEWALLHLLASEPTRVFTKDELIRGVWGTRSLGTSRTLDSHACRLRAKLAVGGASFVSNVWGVGYRLVDPLVPAAA